MGRIAGMIKSAESAMDPSLFSAPKPPMSGSRSALFDQLAALITQSRKDPYADIARMSRFVPTSASEALKSGLKWTGALAGTGAGLAALASYFSNAQEDSRRQSMLKALLANNRLPRREFIVPLATRAAAASDGMSKEAGAGTIAALAAMIGLPKAYSWAKEQVSAVPTAWNELFTRTENPVTHPATIPLLFAGGILGTYGGYKIFDKVFSEMQKRRHKRELVAAEQEFQDALMSQYRKSSSLGAIVDGLALSHATGELGPQLLSMYKKAADADDPYTKAPWYRGYGNMGLGLYAAMLLVLAAGGGMGAWALASKRDLGAKRQSALERTMRRRALASPAQFYVEPTARSTEDEEPI